MIMGAATEIRRKKKDASAKLNLVSLMDIFTILVFFLLINSGDSQDLDKAHTVKLPSSTAQPTLRDELVILVGEQHILVEDVPVANVQEVMSAPDKPIKALATALVDYANKEGEAKGFEKSYGRSVTIMGDRDVPYTLLKSVMATCSQQDFRNISLAVNQVSGRAVAQRSSKGTDATAKQRPQTAVVEG